MIRFRRPLAGALLRHVLPALCLLALLPPLQAQSTNASTCRERAQRLQAAVRRCRERIGAGQIQSCTVTLSWRNGQEIGMQEAESLAAAYLRSAERQEAILREMGEVRALIRRDQRAVTMHGFNRREQDIEDWVRLGTEARDAFKQSVVNGLIDVGLTGAKEALPRMGRFNTSKVNKLIKQMKGLGMDDILLWEAMQAYGRCKTKAETAKTAVKVLERVGKLKDMYLLAKDFSKLQALATGLAWLVEDPRLSLLVTEIDICGAALYNDAARTTAILEIERLNQLSEEELKGIAAVAKVLRGHVERLNGLKGQLAQASGCN